MRDSTFARVGKCFVSTATCRRDACASTSPTSTPPVGEKRMVSERREEVMHIYASADWGWGKKGSRMNVLSVPVTDSTCGWSVNMVKHVKGCVMM